MNGASTNEITLAPPYAFWRRGIAFFLDALILELISVALAWLGSRLWVRLDGWGWLVGLVLAILYFGIGNSMHSNGQTPGKQITKIQVVNRQGGLIPLHRSLLRTVIFSIIVFPFITNQLAGVVYQTLLSRWFATSSLLSTVNMALSIVQVATIYLFVFNRKTRQTLHDLATQTYVVRKAIALPLELPLIWKGHPLIGLMVGIALSIALMPAPRTFVSNSSFPDLIPLEQSLRNTGQFTNVKIWPRSLKISGERKMYTLEVVLELELKHISESLNPLAETVATLATPYRSPTNPFDTLLVRMEYGYNIGFARAQQPFRYRYCWNQTHWTLHDASNSALVIETLNFFNLEFDRQGQLSAWSFGHRHEDALYSFLEEVNQNCAKS